MTRSFWFSFLLFGLVRCGESRVDFHGSTVYRLMPSSDDQAQRISSLEAKYDFWKECVRGGQPCDVMVKEGEKRQLLSWFNDQKIAYSVMIEDVGQLIDQQNKDRLNRQQKVDDEFDYGQYHTLEEIEQWMLDIEAEYSDLIESFIVATSYENRDIKALKISTGGEGKRSIWIDGGIHSREWAAISTVIYFVKELVSQYNVDDEVTAILNEADVYILPVFNVDGYVFSHTTNRMWRKTRSSNDNSPACPGCDPNRNFDIQWATNGTGTNPCSDIYPGQFAFSEIEVRMVADFIENLNPAAMLAYHTYGQMYMTPYGYTYDYPPEYEDLLEACTKGIDALRAVHGVEYRCNTLVNLVGPNSGSSADYTYAVLGIKYSFGVELRDRGRFGFLLPEDQIIPTAEENFAFLKAFLRHVLDDQ